MLTKETVNIKSAWTVLFAGKYNDECIHVSFYPAMLGNHTIKLKEEIIKLNPGKLAFFINIVGHLLHFTAACPVYWVVTIPATLWSNVLVAADQLSRLIHSHTGASSSSAPPEWLFVRGGNQEHGAWRAGTCGLQHPGVQP